jgi:hypothetical protein
MKFTAQPPLGFGTTKHAKIRENNKAEAREPFSVISRLS